MSEKKRRSSSLGKRNKRKGHDAERYYATFFKERLGYKFCQTSRYGSRIYDDSGIDLINLPFLVQVKAGKQKNLNRIATLRYIENRVEENFPPQAPEHEMPKILIERKDVGRGKRRDDYHDIITMTVEDFVKIVNILTNDSQNK